MNNNNLNGYSRWLRDNLWNLIITFATVILAYATMATRVAIIEAKAEILEEKVTTYPSQDYFEEKFRNTDQKLEELKNDLKEHLRKDNK